MGRRYPEIAVTHGRFTDWQQPLIHEMDFRVKDGRAQFRVARDNRATAAARRKR